MVTAFPAGLRRVERVVPAQPERLLEVRPQKILTWPGVLDALALGVG